MCKTKKCKNTIYREEEISSSVKTLEFLNKKSRNCGIIELSIKFKIMYFRKAFFDFLNLVDGTPNLGKIS